MNTIKNLTINKKSRVLLRVDFNVPIQNGEITDYSRIEAAIPTINYLIEKKSRIILLTHRGRPQGIGFEEKFSTKPIYEAIKRYFPNNKIYYSKNIIGSIPQKIISQMGQGDILILENLRFNEGEKKNNNEFAKELAKLGDFYINDAFGVIHRKHASVYGLPLLFETDKKAFGFLIEKELDYLTKKLENPAKPYIFLLGGAKVSDKIDLIYNFIDKADYILIGGGMRFTFWSAMGKKVGNSLLEKDKIEIAKDILNRGKEKIIIAIDAKVVDDIDNPSYIEERDMDNMRDNDSGVDIGSKTIEKFTTIIKKAKTIVFNGPMGIFEDDRYANGTKKIIEAIISSNGLTIAGGGDTSASIKKFHYENKFSHISTGGGAFLELLSGKSLPGIEAME